ncbi:MAG: hypothetical protein INR69_23165, partial [Mucilaginibacter polytrichastri]|nr:hypothetical protein [Mucilaginibacter polytrichastri]
MITRALFPALLCLALFSGVKKASAQAIKDWKGQLSSDWNTAGNWSPAGVPAPADVVRIGIADFTGSTLAVGSSVSCAAMEFGTFAPITITISDPAKLTVSGGVQVNSKPNMAQNDRFKITMDGSGSLQMGFVQIGSSLQPTNAGRAYTMLDLNVENVYIPGNVVMNSVANSGSTGTYYPEFYLNRGTLTLDGKVITQNTNTYTENAAGVPQYRSMFRIVENTTNATLILRNTEAIPALAAGHCIDMIGGSSGISTIIYENNSSQTQIVYPAPNVPVGEQPFNYKSIALRGSGPKVVFPNSFGSTLTIGTSYLAEGGKVDFVTNKGSIEFKGTTQIQDNGTDNGRGSVFYNVLFSNNNTKTLTATGSGRFGVAPGGSLRLSAGNLNTGGLLTLQSDATGSANVLSLPSGSSITGNVNVERFVKGSYGRGYRLISSPVYSSTAGGYPYFTAAALLNSTLVSGRTGGGFDPSSLNNPSLWVYREGDPSPKNA